VCIAATKVLSEPTPEVHGGDLLVSRAGAGRRSEAPPSPGEFTGTTRRRPTLTRRDGAGHTRGLCAAGNCISTRARAHIQAVQRGQTPANADDGRPIAATTSGNRTKGPLQDLEGGFAPTTPRQDRHENHGRPRGWAAHRAAASFGAGPSTGPGFRERRRNSAWTKPRSAAGGTTSKK